MMSPGAIGHIKMVNMEDVTIQNRQNVNRNQIVHVSGHTITVGQVIVSVLGT